MTMLWAAISILTLLVLAMLALPLLRKHNDNKPTAADYDVAVYKSQLEEVEREAARGAFSPEEADAAKSEIARRLLAADSKNSKQAMASETTSQASFKFIMTIMALLVGVAAITLYLELGSPGLPANPLAGREAEKIAAQEAAKKAGGMDDVIVKLEERLAADPNSIDGWMLLGRSYLATGQLEAAINAYEKAIALNRNQPGLLSTYGEILVMQTQGGVLEPTMNLFREAVALDPNDVRARFYLAEGTYQAGKPAEALEAFIAITNSAPATAPWQPMVQEAATAIANELSMNIQDRMPVIPETTGPSEEEMAAADEMTAEDRQSMIQSMVEQLADKLKEDPDNLEGWMRLAQSYMVLQQFDNAVLAYEKAIALSPDNQEIMLMNGRALRGVGTESARDQACQLMEQVLATDSSNLEALWMIAIDEADRGNKDQAQSYFDRALNLVGKTSGEYIELKMEADNILSKM